MTAHVILAIDLASERTLRSVSGWRPLSAKRGLLDVEYVTHTCPGDLEPHIVETRQRIVHVTPGRACQTPVTVRCGDTNAVVACGTIDPARRQCSSCRTVITVHRVRTVHLGYQGPPHLAPATRRASA